MWKSAQTPRVPISGTRRTGDGLAGVHGQPSAGPSGQPPTCAGREEGCGEPPASRCCGDSDATLEDLRAPFPGVRSLNQTAPGPSRMSRGALKHHLKVVMTRWT